MHDIEFYSIKCVISGENVYVYEYSRNISRVGSRTKSEKEKSSKLRDDAIQYNIDKCKTTLKYLIECNLDLSKFITLTFKENEQSLEKANYKLNLFCKRLKRLYPNAKYICIPEYQKRGAVHYHLLCSIPYIRQKTLENIWGYGYVWINAIKHINSISLYLVKYITKDYFNVRYKKKKYFKSQNLHLPKTLYNEDVLAYLNSKTLYKKFEKEYSLFNGTVKLINYNLIE